LILISKFHALLNYYIKMQTRQIVFDLVVAQAINRGIGVNNSLPWKIPRDLKMFKKITTSGS